MSRWLRRVCSIAVLVALSAPAFAQNPDALKWSTFLGGVSSEFNAGVAVDASGFIWYHGMTESPDFPTTPGAFSTTYMGSDGQNGGPPFSGDGFITKVDPNTGQVLYSTFIGGSGDEELDRIVIDSSGFVYGFGYTFSADFPTTVGAYDTTPNGAADFFIFKLNPTTGTLVYSTLIGGSGDEMTWENACFAVDGAGNAYFAGHVTSTDMPVTGGAFQSASAGGQDAVVGKLSADGSTLTYLSYLGSPGLETIHGLTLLASGEVVVTGRTTNGGFPVTPGVFQPIFGGGSGDAYITKLNTTGTGLVFSTFVGGATNERGWTILPLASGDLICLGLTTSPTFPTTAGAFDQTHNGLQDSFVIRFDSSATTRLASTYVGGIQSDQMTGGVLDASENIWFAGETRSTGYPTTRGSYDISFNGGDNDCFLACINSSLTSVLYSTFIGGFGVDYSLHIASSGNYIFGGGTAWSPNFPTTPGAYDTTFSGDGVVTGDSVALKIDPSTATLDTDSDGMPDWWEKLYSLDHLVANAGVDVEPDGLTNLQEFTNDTNPTKADPDGDGLTDGEEINTYGTDPKQKDMDLDGLTDREEVADLDLIAGGVQNPFNPTNPDTTGDSGSNVADTFSDGNNDYDSDTISNKVEFRDGTSPIDGADFKLHPPKTLSITDITEIVPVPLAQAPYEMEWSHDGTKLAFEDFALNTRNTVPSDGSQAPTSLGTAGLVRGIAWGYGDNSLWHSHDTLGERLVETMLSPPTTLNSSGFIGQLAQPTLTERTGTNFLAYLARDGDADVDSLAINSQGFLASISQKVRLTNIAWGADEGFTEPEFSPDGDRMALSYIPPGLNTTQRHVVTVLRVLDTLNGLATAPTTYADPRFKVIDSSANYKYRPCLTPDGETVLYTMDINGVFDSGINNFGATDFEIAYAPADGTGSVTTVAMPGNQGIARVSSGGARLAFVSDVGHTGAFSIYTGRLEASTPVPGTPAGANQGGAGNDGINDVVTTDDAVISDVSATVVDVPANTVIDFPIGEPQEISISTPTAPVPPSQMPAGVDELTVIRDFGPDGTQFTPAISVTITYTEAELNGADEASLAVYLFNTGTSQYEAIPSGDIIAHDLDQNTITFLVDHFSLYGLGGPVDTDGDGQTDDIDTDDDNDGILDGSDPNPLDTDNDGTANDTDPDDDRDGILDNVDTSLLDSDNDGSANSVDTDDDADGILDTSDSFLFDSDNDGTQNDLDGDDDGDGIVDVTEGVNDLDGDNIPNHLDTDSDGDSYSDSAELLAGSDPYNASSIPSDAVPLRAWPLVLLLVAVMIAVGARRKRLTQES